jgi:hypothetical protein
MAGQFKKLVDELREGGHLPWDDVAQLSESKIAKSGMKIAAANARANAIRKISSNLFEARRNSPRLASSGMTNSMTRKERKAHYTRKAILESKKEDERRRVWARRHPGASEGNWRRREEARKTRKADERQRRKMT